MSENEKSHIPIHIGCGLIGAPKCSSPPCPVQPVEYVGPEQTFDIGSQHVSVTLGDKTISVPVADAKNMTEAEEAGLQHKLRDLILAEQDANQAKLWIDLLRRARANVLERDESLGDDLGEICVHWADRLRALAFEIHGVLCNQCQGTGFKVYALGGQSLAEGVCDTCWGTGRTDETGTDLRAIEAWAERIRAMSVEEISKRSEREVLAPMRAMGAELRGVLALEVIERFGGTNELHHLRWVVDQVARRLTGSGYDKWVTEMREHDSEAYEWDEGIAP